MAGEIGRWKSEALAYGQRFIDELDEPNEWEAYVSSDGISKRFGVYNKVTCDTVLVLYAPTYYDLFRAVQFAWNIHTMANRGF